MRLKTRAKFKPSSVKGGKPSVSSAKNGIHADFKPRVKPSPRYDDLIAGLHTVHAVLQQAPETIKQLLISAKITLTDDEERLIAASGAEVTRLEMEALTKLTGFMQHQGWAARVRRQLLAFHPETELAQIVAARGQDALFLVLDQVQDPHNLGACWRSANAFGVDAIIVPKDHTCPVTPVVTKASAGALLTPPIVAVTNLARCLQQLKKLNVWVYGFDERGASALGTVKLAAGPTALVFGSEGSGIRQLVLKQCDARVRIPMLGSVPCLNVSVAVSVSLYAVQQQRDH